MKPRPAGTREVRYIMAAESFVRAEWQLKGGSIEDG
jgi:hypothetical protein